MTHRSRSGGPPRNLGGRKPGSKKKGPKRHHPPHRGGGDGSSESEADTAPTNTVPTSAFDNPTDSQVLHVLRSALSTSLDSPDFVANVQKAKSLLYDRKWLELFTDPALLDAYAGRWVPSRALCFRELMAGMKDVRALFSADDEDESESKGEGEGEGEGEDEGAESTAEKPEADKPEADKTDETEKTTTTPKHILSIGGGAGSELLAVAALSASCPDTPIKWTGVDIGDWSSVLTRIEEAVRDKWEINATFEFIECDVLASPTTTNQSAPSPTVPPFLPPLGSIHLTTIFFTLTELLSQNRARTLALLRGLTAQSTSGAHLLVVDSASDIAEFPLGKDGRTWPVYMVLDALMKALGGWERVRHNDSRWFRLSDEAKNVRWPCKLENARYWVRMYRRV